MQKEMKEKRPGAQKYTRPHLGEEQKLQMLVCIVCLVSPNTVGERALIQCLR